MKRLYIAAYHQSKFGKLFDMTVPAIVDNAISDVCSEIGAEPTAIDVGSIGATCNFSLNEQGLLAGLVAMTPGLGAKPIEAVENACASGGQAVVSVIQKLQLGIGEVGVAVGYEKMRNDEGKMDGKLVGTALGVFSHPGEREGKHDDAGQPGKGAAQHEGDDDLSPHADAAVARGVRVLAHGPDAVAQRRPPQ